MKLGDYLKENHLKAKLIAEKIGTSQAHVSLWLNGKTVPRKETMKKIEKLTNGKVKFADWFSE
jgi:transcriptional regulator with XRE-family HTH domain